MVDSPIFWGRGNVDESGMIYRTNYYSPGTVSGTLKEVCLNGESASQTSQLFGPIRHKV